MSILENKKNEAIAEETRVRHLKNLTNRELENSKKFMIEQKNLFRLIREQRRKLKNYYCGIIEKKSDYQECSFLSNSILNNVEPLSRFEFVYCFTLLFLASLQINPSIILILFLNYLPHVIYKTCNIFLKVRNIKKQIEKRYAYD